MSCTVNKLVLRRYVLDYAERTRHHKFGRLSRTFFEDADFMLRKWARDRVDSHPSIGKTLR